MRTYIFPLFILLFAFTSCGHQDKPNGEAEQEIIERSQAYQNALNNHDVNALIDFWADDAVYRNPLSGKLVQGQNQIKEEYIELFNHISGTTIAMERESISFPFDDKAVEQGVFHIRIPGQAPFDHDYKIIYVKRKGKWKILNISEINFDKK